MKTYWLNLTLNSTTPILLWTCNPTPYPLPIFNNRANRHNSLNIITHCIRTKINSFLLISHLTVHLVKTTSSNSSIYHYKNRTVHLCNKIKRFIINLDLLRFNKWADLLLQLKSLLNSNRHSFSSTNRHKTHPSNRFKLQPNSNIKILLNRTFKSIKINLIQSTLSSTTISSSIRISNSILRQCSEWYWWTSLEKVWLGIKLFFTKIHKSK